MREIVGELWHYWKKKNHVVLITTNGSVRSDGRLVMGRGNALEAMQRIGGLSARLGNGVKRHGNRMQMYREGRNGILLTFPVKHEWSEMADIDLIRTSASQLLHVVKKNPGKIFVLPRPGCNNGGLKWTEVKPLIQHLPDNVLVISKQK